MAFNFTLPIRIAQAVFVIVVLGLTAYVAHWINNPRTPARSPDENNFLIFTSVWTIVVLVYLLVTPWLLPRFAHRFAVLAVEALTMLFWFAGFIALAVYTSGVSYICSGHVCNNLKAACVFGAFEWLLWSASTVLATLQVTRSRGNGPAKPMGASDRLPEALALPPKWLGLYGDFVTKNASSVSQIESALRSLTYIIPGRFRESELASESLHSSIQLLSIYHDSLLARAVARLPPTQKPSPSPHNRYTRFWTQKSTLYRRISLTLQVLQYTELLIEMAAKRRGERIRWRVVVLLEFVKAMCRLGLLRLTNSRPLVTPPLPEREIDPTKLGEEQSQEEEGFEDDQGLDGEFGDERQQRQDSDTAWSMPRTGLTLPSLPASPDVTNYLLSKVLTADDLKPPKALLHRVSGPGQLAEILYILRPVIYALAMQHWNARTVDSTGKRGKSNWQPWLLGLSIEYGARQLAKKDFKERVAGGLRGLTGLEREELRRRGWAMGWWALRGAFYENVTRPYLSSFTSKLRNKPLLNLLGGVVEDYEYLWEEYYFPTATL
ncbi:MAG: Peroxisomal membrane protein pex16 [Sclerophora amabilis]|nr:MAG: Peroxisomal membrane protein pex16 [Sclerophora amabilis]